MFALTPATVLAMPVFMHICIYFDLYRLCEISSNVGVPFYVYQTYNNEGHIDFGASKQIKEETFKRIFLKSDKRRIKGE